MTNTTIDHEASDEWADWPRCPRCERRRQTMCDSCQYAADQFPLAEYLEAMEVTPIGKFEGGQLQEDQPRDSTFRVLLMCPRCDEAFAPKFYRTCHWCGHEFESGREIENPLAEQLTPRVMWTIFALSLLVVASLFYFMIITS